MEWRDSGIHQNKKEVFCTETEREHGSKGSESKDWAAGLLSEDRWNEEGALNNI